MISLTGGKEFATLMTPHKSRGGALNGLYFLLEHKYFYEKDNINYDNKSIKWSSTNSSGTLVSFDICLRSRPVDPNVVCQSVSPWAC